MQTESVTTPFGRRPMSLALVRRQQAVSEIKAGKSADKWKVFRDVSAAMASLGLQSASLSVLDALLSFHPETELRQDGQLIVFPSNIQLSLRAHGMPGSTLRRHLAALVEAGLISRKDSANGKRFARKDGTGAVESAYGFDLSPLLARAEELAVLAQEVVAARAAFRKAKETLTICRRDVRKLITAAIEEGACGDWQAVEERYIGIVGRIPRSPRLEDLTDFVEELRRLKDDILKRLESQHFSQKSSSNDDQTGQHIQNSNTHSSDEFEPALDQSKGDMPSAKGTQGRETLKAFPLSMVLKACPEIALYGTGGAISNWRDLMSAAVVVRSMLGVSPSAYQEACEVMGPEIAATAMACILERAGQINSAGGYLRDLTRRARAGEFGLGPMLMSLIRANSSGQRRSA